MNLNNFNSVVNDTIESLRKLTVLKGGEYAPGDDRLANFKENCEIGILPEASLAVHLQKHYGTFRRYLKTVIAGEKDIQRSEPIENRIDDMIVYLTIAKGIIAERKELEIQGRLKKQRK